MNPNLEAVVVCACSAAVARAAGVLALWLQLKGQERRERERREHLVTAARELSAGSEVLERFGDGGILTVKTDREAAK